MFANGTTPQCGLTSTWAEAVADNRLMNGRTMEKVTTWHIARHVLVSKKRLTLKEPPSLTKPTTAYAPPGGPAADSPPQCATGLPTKTSRLILVRRSIAPTFGNLHPGRFSFKQAEHTSLDGVFRSIRSNDGIGKGRLCVRGQLHSKERVGLL